MAKGYVQYDNCSHHIEDGILKNERDTKVYAYLSLADMFNSVTVLPVATEVNNFVDTIYEVEFDTATIETAERKSIKVWHPKVIRQVTQAEMLLAVNMGDNNLGQKNIGKRNIGDNNMGDGNKGHWNHGCINIGHKNLGSYNIGSENKGDHNIGDDNVGRMNIGHDNVGYWNKTNYEFGCFNTRAATIYMFNKPSKWTIEDWYESKACAMLSDLFIFCDKSWQTMTAAERKKYPYAEHTGHIPTKLRKKWAQEWWNDLLPSEKKIIKSLPNFNKKIFKEITGIVVK